MSNTPYTIPALPGALTLPPNIDAAEAVRRKKDHQKIICKFREIEDIKKTLIRQIVSAIDGQFIDKVCNESINTITKSIPEILQYLFDNFLDVTSHDVVREENKIRDYLGFCRSPLCHFTNLLTNYTY